MGVLVLAAAASLSQAVQSPPDWGNALRTDASAMHAAIATSHPGPVNPRDPGFAARNDVQLARALARARSANSFAHYFYAMQEYAASFDDGHLSFGVWGNTPDAIRTWPGFLTRYDDRGNQNVFVSEPWGGAPLGSRLLSCDGRKADLIAKERVGSRFGRWQLAAQRQLWGGMTFLDTGNPYVRPIRSCRFKVRGRVLQVALRWRAPDQDLFARYLFPRSTRAEIGWQQLASGISWFTIPTFDGNPDSPAGQKLRELLAYLDGSGAAVRASRAVVFDLRGNGGGSSDWSYQIARRLWGDGLLARRPEPPMTVSWRASADNLAAVRASFAERVRGGHLSLEAKGWFQHTIAGLERAVSAREPLWTIRPEPSSPPTRNAGPPQRLRGPVYIVTDYFCMSACLDAVDLWTRLGAIPIGRETGADTFYMEVRQVPLPAGLGGVTIPMKVYSGRARGSNEPVVPLHLYRGEITDTQALQSWVATLPELQGN